VQVSFDKMKSTLFPNITTKPYAVLRALAELPGMSQTDPSLKNVVLIGTTKLHGMHADIVVDGQDNITFQSRNVANVTIETDTYGFAAKMTPKKGIILTLKRQILRRFEEVNPGVAIDEKHPLVIAGEFIGEGIMKSTAINCLPQIFVILVIAINGVWQPIDHYPEIQNESCDIYNISRGGVFRRTINLIEPKESFENLMVATRGVEYRCPFALSFGICGPGEGLVWKPEGYQHLPAAWLKTKGARFMTRANAEAVPKAKSAKEEKVAEFAAAVLTTERYEQGVAYMKEMRIPCQKHTMGTFLEWVSNDVLEEEHWSIIVEGIDRAALQRFVVHAAKKWYLDKVIVNQKGSFPTPMN
jgi:RNA ligase